jgi:hypothetical protein
MKIAVVGCGFVGGTVADFLEEHTAKDGVEVIRCDPFKYDDGLDHTMLRNLDGAIFCINAPTGKDNQVDIHPSINAVRDVMNNNPGVKIMVKSTVPMFTKLTEGPDQPGNWPEEVIFNPEFLRESTAKEDFANQKHFIIGVAKHLITNDLPAEDNPHAKFWTNIFAPSLPDTEFIYTDRETAAMVKYTHNAWLATKVAWFHELSTQMPGLSDYNEVVSILSKFENIGPSHMSIPNAEGGLGFGGGCFPKDISALSHIISHDLINQTIDTNYNLKKNRKGGTEGVTQRVSYDHYKKQVPNEPFILFIGTSHTYGECEGIKVPSYAELLQDILDIKVVWIGFSGANNMELLQVTNELNDIGMFNENCKLVILEPRITENSHTVSLDEVIGYEGLLNWLEVIENPKPWNKKHIKDWNDEDWQVENDELVYEELWRGKPHLNRTTMNSEVQNGEELVFGRTLVELVSKNMNFNRAMDRKILKDDIINHLNNGDPRLNNSMFLKSVTSELEKNIDAVQQSSQYNLAYKNSSVLEMHKDLTCIEAIRNTVKNSGVPFRWMLIDNRLEELHYLQYVTNGITDIFKDMLFSTPLQALVTGNRLSKHRDIAKDIICNCGHFNEKGNWKLAEEFVGPAVVNVLNKIEEIE